MQAIGGIFNSGGAGSTGTAAEARALLLSQMALLPPPDPSDVAFLTQNADLIRDDYAQAFGTVYAATAAGKKAKLVCYGIGGALGLVLGVALGKLVL